MARGTEGRRNGPATEHEAERHERFGREREERMVGPAVTDRGASRGGLTAFLAVLALAVVVALGLAIWAWVDDSAGPNVGVTVDEVAGDAGEWYGEIVTVSGEVDQLVPLVLTGTDAGAGATRSGVAFTLGGDAFGEQLLVVAPNAPYPFVDEDSVVQVTGTVRQFSPTGFASAFGAEDEGWFDSGLFGEWDGRPAIVAQSIDPTVPSGDAS